MVYFVSGHPDRFWDHGLLLLVKLAEVEFLFFACRRWRLEEVLLVSLVERTCGGDIVVVVEDGVSKRLLEVPMIHGREEDFLNEGTIFVGGEHSRRLFTMS